VFTVAGGDDAAPLDGLSATQARIFPTAVTVAADGAIVFIDHGHVWAIGLDGRLHALAGGEPLAR
jgi:hypothetical protein